MRILQRKLSRIALKPIIGGCGTSPNFAEKTFADGSQTSKFAKVFSLESFPLYGIDSFVFCNCVCVLQCPMGPANINQSIDEHMGDVLLHSTYIHIHRYSDFSYEKLVWGSLWLAPIVFNSHSGPDWPGLQLNDPVTSSLKQVFHHFQQFWCT